MSLFSHHTCCRKGSSFTPRYFQNWLPSTQSSTTATGTTAVAGTGGISPDVGTCFEGADDDDDDDDGDE